MKAFDTKISGIPCICEVTHYLPGAPDRVGGRVEDSEPGYASEFEFKILTTKGKSAPWLEHKVTAADIERLEEEWRVTLLEQKHCWNED